MSTTSLLPSLPPQPANLLAAYWPTAAALLLPLSLLLLLCGPLPLFTHLRTEPGRPPLVSSIVPWLGSYRAMRRDFDGFVESARKQYGECFGVTSLGRRMYYVTSAPLISTIYKTPSAYALSPLQFQWMQNIFGLSAGAAANVGAVGQEMFPLIHKALSPAHVHGLGEAFAASAAARMRSLAEELKAGAGHRTVLLLPFIHGGVFDAATHALFGPSFPASKLQPSFSTFDSSVPALAMGLPSSLDVPFTRARAHLLRIFEQYLSAPAFAGASELIDSVVHVARAHAWSGRDTAVWLLALLWPLQANSPFAVYWLLALMLRAPGGLEPLVQEVDAARAEWEKAHPAAPFADSVVQFVGEAQLPRLTSAVQETLRYATGSFSVRCVEAESVRLGGYELRKGDHIVCSVRSLHLSEDIFEDAGKFMPTRFMDRQHKQPSYLPFGGGISQCEGRFLALSQIRTFVVLLLTTFDIKLDDRHGPDVRFGEGQRGFGMIRPKGDLQVILTPREGHAI